MGLKKGVGRVPVVTLAQAQRARRKMDFEDVSMAEAARALGVHRSALWRALDRHGLSNKDVYVNPMAMKLQLDDMKVELAELRALLTPAALGEQVMV